MSSDVHAPQTPDHAVPGAGDHHAGGDHGDDHGHGEVALGPIDTTAWLAGLLGVVLGVAVAICFILATGDVGVAAV